MRFIPLQKWYDIILCCHSNRKGQTGFMTLKEGNLWYKFEGPSCYGNQVVYSFYVCSGMKRMPVLILKSQTHTFSQTNNFS